MYPYQSTPFAIQPQSANDQRNVTVPSCGWIIPREREGHISRSRPEFHLSLSYLKIPPCLLLNHLLHRHMLHHHLCSVRFVRLNRMPCLPQQCLTPGLGHMLHLLLDHWLLALDHLTDLIGITVQTEVVSPVEAVYLTV